MKMHNAPKNHHTRRILPIACATALTVAFAISLPAHAGKVTPPPVPFNLKVEAGNHPFLVGHAVGTQNYVCAPSTTSDSGGVAYVLFTPEATLFNDEWSINSSPTSSALTRTPTTPTLVQRWWPMAQFAPRGCTRGTGARSGRRCTPMPARLLSPRQDCHSLAPARRGWNRRRTRRWQHSVEDHPGPAAEHHWRGRTGPWL